MSLRDPKTQKILLAAVLCGLALWGYFLSDLLPFGYRRETQKVRELGAAQETVAAELEKARRAVADLPRLEQEQADLERKWVQAESLLPTDKEMAELLTQITQAGDHAGVTFKLFKPGAQRPQEFYNENPVNIQVHGGFHQVGVMLARLANMQRIVNVTDLSLEAAKQRSRNERGKSREKTEGQEERRTDHTLLASFTATAYSLRDPATEPPPAPPAEAGTKRAIRTAPTRPTAPDEASVGGTSKTTPGAVTKRLSQKAKAKKSGEEAP